MDKVTLIALACLLNAIVGIMLSFLVLRLNAKQEELSKKIREISERAYGGSSR